MNPGQECLRERCPIVVLASKHPEAFDVTESKPGPASFRRCVCRGRARIYISGAAPHQGVQEPFHAPACTLKAREASLGCRGAAEPEQQQTSLSPFICQTGSQLVINLSEDWSRSFGASKQASADVTTTKASVPALNLKLARTGLFVQTSDGSVWSADLRPQGQNGRETPRPLTFDL